MPDMLIQCADCGRRFTWSVGEQHFYRQRGLSQPKRCKACRDRQKQERQASGQAVSDTPVPLPAGEPISRRLRELSAQLPPRRYSHWWRNPIYRFALLSLGLVLVLLAAVRTWLPGLLNLGLGLVWLLAINITTLLVYRYDKSIAGRSETRVPEIILLGLALLGGSPAAYFAMYHFRRRHKTQSPGFLLAYWSIVALQIVGLIFYFGF
jgi:uncharacterized membrane protein YsdA (DUF1294 family)